MRIVKTRLALKVSLLSKKGKATKSHTALVQRSLVSQYPGVSHVKVAQGDVQEADEYCDTPYVLLEASGEIEEP